MESLSIVYCSGANLRPEVLKELTSGFQEVPCEIFEVKDSGPFDVEQLSASVTLRRIPSLGHALFEATGTILHCIATPNTWMASSEYRSALESFSLEPEVNLLFVSSLLENENTFHTNEKRDLRRSSFLRILNKQISGNEFRGFVRNSGTSGLRAKVGTFFLRRSALPRIPAPPGSDDTSVVSILPTIVAQTGMCLNRSDLILRTHNSPLEENLKVGGDDYERRLLYSLGWALDWWATQAEQEDLAAFAHSVMVPFDMLRLAGFSSSYLKYLSPSVLKNIDFLTVVTKNGVDGAELLRTVLSQLPQECGEKIDVARVNEIVGVAEFVRKALGEFHSVHEIVDEEMTEAENALKRGEYEVASKLFEAAVKKYPNLVDAYLGWAEASASLGKNDLARKCLNYVQSRSAKTPSFSLRLGNLLFRLGDSAEAKRHYQQSIILDNNNPASYFNMAIIVSREGKYDEGLRHARAALNCQPEDASLSETVAFLEFKCGLRDEAVSRLNSLLVQYPQRPETQALLQQVQSSR